MPIIPSAKEIHDMCIKRRESNAVWRRSDGEGRIFIPILRILREKHRHQWFHFNQKTARKHGESLGLRLVRLHNARILNLLLADSCPGSENESKFDARFRFHLQKTGFHGSFWMLDTIIQFFISQCILEQS